MKFRVKIPFMAVYRRGDGTSEFIRLEAGTLLGLRGEMRPGLVKVMCQGRLLSVFMSDLEQRAVKVSSAWT